MSDFLNLAKIEAENSSFSDWRIGAVIVKNGKVISKGHNRLSGKVKTRKRLDFLSLHAEADAILNCNDFKRLKGARIYVAGVKYNGNGVNARPCMNCLSMIARVGIKRVYYNDHGKRKRIILGE